jgi:hypothetical protein
MMRRCFQCLASFFLLWSGAACFGQTIKIRITDVKEGRPLGKLTVSVGLVYDKNEKPPPDVDTHFLLETDSNGDTQFTLPKPPPSHVAAQAHLTWEHWHCGCAMLIATRDLLQNGFVAGDPRSKAARAAAPLKADPGEILFVASRFSFWERLLYPLTKE